MCRLHGPLRYSDCQASDRGPWPYLSEASVPRAGAGLEPDVTDAKANGFEIVAEFVEVETGKGSALAKARREKCAVVVAKLDRLSRGATRTTSADRLLRHIEARGLTLEWILDTHPGQTTFQLPAISRT